MDWKEIETITGAIEPRTSYKIEVHITKFTTAGKRKNDREYYDIDVPSSGPDLVVDWTSGGDSLNKLIDQAHSVLDLHNDAQSPAGIDPFV